MQQRAIGEVEAGRQALQVAQSQQALDQRVQDAEEPEISRHSLRLQKMPAKSFCNLSMQHSNPSKGHKLINKPLREPCNNHKSEKGPCRKESPLLNKRQENKCSSSNKECKKLSKEQRRQRGELVKPKREEGRNLRKVSLHGWCTGKKSTSQSRNLEEEAGEW